MIRSVLSCVSSQILTNRLDTKRTVFGIVFMRSFSQPTMTVKVSNDIIKSEQDQRLYRGLKLSNGLKVVLVSDPTTDKSAASMDINIGAMSDPSDLPGLAHFCEHMLFLGTKKYPDENEYSKYLSENSGSNNAYTSVNHTNYHFDVSPDALPGALDRFAQFFLEPLFTESAVDREVNAVDSEHSKNVMNDFWRMNQLEKSTCDPNHDYSKFTTGNKETLATIPKSKGESVREALLKFHTKWYSSNIMGLSVIGKESLDDLQKLVEELFSDIKNKEVVVPEWCDHPFTEDCLQKMIYVSPVKDIRQLNVTFPIPDLDEHYRTAPGHYLGHLIAHEGPGSLLSFLKSKGWVNSLVGGQNTAAKGFGFFIVHADLTEEGLNHIEDIVTAIFQYLELLKEAGPQEWVFEECKDISNMLFRFKDKEKPQSYVSNIAKSLQMYPMEEVVSASYLLNEYKPELITSTLDCLTPDKIRVTVISKSMDEIVDLKEKWYGTGYKIECVDKDTLHRWKNPGVNPELALPPKNEFVPSNFTIYTADDVSAVPVLLDETPMYRIWYKLDDEFKLPKATFKAELFSPKAYADPKNANLLHVFINLFKDALNEYSYAAQLTELGYSLSNTPYGLVLGLSGFNDKLPTLLEKVMEKLTSFKIDAKRFYIHKENYTRALRNFAAEQPYTHLFYYSSLILSDSGWSQEELLSCEDDITVENMEVFIKDLLSNLHIEFLVHGNVTKDTAKQICSVVESKLTTHCGTKPLLPSQFCRKRELQLQRGCNHVFEAENSVHKSSAVEALYQFDESETHENMLGQMLVQIFSEPVFQQLRTKEQLGYIVWCMLRNSRGTLGLRIVLQGDKAPAYLDSRIEAFLVMMRETLKTMTDEEYNCHRESLAQRRKERPKKLHQLSSIWWQEIVSNQYNFNRDEIEVEHLMTITKEQVVEFFEKRLWHESADRKKLSVQVKSSCLEEDTVTEEKSDEDLPPAPVLKPGKLITNILEFKHGRPLYPLMTPIIPLTKESKSKL